MSRRPAAVAVLLALGLVAAGAGRTPGGVPAEPVGGPLGGASLPVITPSFTPCGTSEAQPARTNLRPRTLSAADAHVDPERFGAIPVDGALVVEDVGDLVLTDGVLDAGNGYEVGYAATVEPDVQVSDATVTAPVAVAVLDTTSSGRRVAAVEVRVGSGTPVRWEVEPDLSFGTDGGDGGFLATRGLPTGAEVDGWGFIEAFYPDGDSASGIVCVLRRTSAGGPVDGVLFSTGWGDGGYPVLLGRAADGAVVSVVCWTGIVPWEWSGLAGEAPDGV